MTIYFGFDQRKDGTGQQVMRRINNMIKIEKMKKLYPDLNIEYVHVPVYFARALKRPFKGLQETWEENYNSLESEKWKRWARRYKNIELEIAKVICEYFNLHKFTKSINDIDISKMKIIRDQTIHLRDIVDIKEDTYIFNCKIRFRSNIKVEIVDLIKKNINCSNEISDFFSKNRKGKIINIHIRGGDISNPKCSAHKRYKKNDYFLNKLEKLFTKIDKSKCIVNIFKQKDYIDEDYKILEFKKKNDININIIYEEDYVKWLDVDKIKKDLDCIRRMILCDYFIPSPNCGFSDIIIFYTNAKIIT